MRMKGLGVAIVGLAVIGLVAAPAGAQSRGDDQGEKDKLERLWRLYPLDPEAGHVDAETESEAAVPTEAPPASTEREAPGRPDAPVAEDEKGGRSGVVLLIAVVTLGVGVLSVRLVSRRSTRSPQTSRPSTEREEAVVGAHPPAEAERPANDQPAPSGLVRVHLHDGRVVQGRVKHAATNDNPVMLLDVVEVTNAAGHRTEPELLDAFLPLAEVDHIETVGEMDSSLSRGREGGR
jgi:hypothetical protein